MQQGANALAEGSRAIADGVQELVDQTKKLGAGLNEASSFLLGMKHDAENAVDGRLQYSATGTDRRRVQESRPDFHVARRARGAVSRPKRTQSVHHRRHGSGQHDLTAARSAQPNTELSDATISLAGIPTGLRDTRDYYNNDINFIVFATIIIVFLILVVLLRAIVAPLYLIGSVLISFLSALGIGVIVFQLILGKELHWSLPGSVLHLVGRGRRRLQHAAHLPDP